LNTRIFSILIALWLSHNIIIRASNFMFSSYKIYLIQKVSFVPFVNVQYFALEKDYTITFCLALLHDTWPLLNENRYP
jgi:hypothetical protein